MVAQNSHFHRLSAVAVRHRDQRQGLQDMAVDHMWEQLVAQFQEALDKALDCTVFGEDILEEQLLEEAGIGSSEDRNGLVAVVDMAQGRNLLQIDRDLGLGLVLLLALSPCQMNISC